MDNLSLSFILFQVVCPKQWTTWVYLSFPKKVSSPASSENEMSLNPSHHYQMSFPHLSDYGIPKVVPRFIGLRSIKVVPRFIGLRNTKIIVPRFIELWNINSFIPRFVGLRNIKIIVPRFIGLRNNKCLSSVCRITEGHSGSIFLTVSSPSMSNNETSLNFSFLKKLSSPDLSDNEMPKGVIPSVSGQGLSLNTVADNHLPQ